MSNTVLVLLLIALLFAFALAWRLSAGRWSRASRARNARARLGEEHAVAVLERAGFSVAERQVTRRWVLEVDGEPWPVHCRADFLVERGGESFVADVKTGTRAPDPSLPATRRQLLEYHLALGVSGVLVVDMESRQVRSVRFPWV